MGRHAESRFFKWRKLPKPNGKAWYMIEGRPKGVRERYYFDTEKEARKAVSNRNLEITAFGSENTLPDTERVMAAECIKILKPFGKTLYNATHFYHDYLQKTESSITVTQLCEVVRERFEKRLSDKDGTSLRHKLTMDSCLKAFEARFGKSPIKTLTGIEVKDWLEGTQLAIKTRNKYLGYLQTAFEVAVEKGLVAENPFERVKKFPRMDKFKSKPPTPLTPEEAERLLNNAEPSVLPFIALGLFAGLRTAERDNLDWSDVHLSEAEPYIDLSAKISKTGRRRLIPIQPALKAFLDPHAKPEGRIVPLTVNGKLAYQNAWERAAKGAGLWPWPENSLRDSFVSYRYADTGSADKTAEEAGHSVQIMFDKYRAIIRSKEATANFWAIRPGSK